MPSSINGGQFCEIVYNVLQGYLDGSYAAAPSKPRNFVEACRELEGRPASSARTGDRSVRVLIPRILLGIYEVRNNRGVGHAGGDVNPNHADCTLVVSSASWVMSELIRVLHNTDLAAATAIVEKLTERINPVVWRVGNRRRVLNTSWSMKDKMLLLLYDAGGEATDDELVTWTEHSNAAVFRRDILRPAHSARLIEYRSRSEPIHLSPIGLTYVEDNGLLA